MSDAVFYWLCGAGVFALVAWALVILFRFYNSPDAERYRRTAMQGPFAPLSDADNAADEKRESGHG
jgi:hypothetical protein